MEVETSIRGVSERSLVKDDLGTLHISGCDLPSKLPNAEIKGSDDTP